MEPLEVTDKHVVYPKKPLIKKGYYKARLLEIKPRADKNGVLVEAQYGHQVILLFQILNEEGRVMEYQDGDETREVILPMMLYYESKQKDGSYSTSVTPNSKITKTFEALGWNFDPNAKLDMDSFIGKSAEANINDYEGKDGEVMSVIKELTLIKDQPQSYPKEIPVNLNQ